MRRGCWDFRTLIWRMLSFGLSPSDCCHDVEKKSFSFNVNFKQGIYSALHLDTALSDHRFITIDRYFVLVQQELTVRSMYALCQINYSRICCCAVAINSDLSDGAASWKRWTHASACRRWMAAQNISKFYLERSECWILTKWNLGWLLARSLFGVPPSSPPWRCGIERQIEFYLFD